MDQKGIVISGYVCVGKSTVVKKYDNIIDVESNHSQYLWTDEQKKAMLEDDKFLEKLKGTNKPKNLKYPDNYIDDIIKAMDNYKVVLIAPGLRYLKLLAEYGIEPVLVFPGIECRVEYIKRAKERGNPMDFVRGIDERWEEGIEKRMALPNKKIILGPGEYLEDGLLREGYLTEQDLKPEFQQT